MGWWERVLWDARTASSRTSRVSFVLSGTRPTIMSCGERGTNRLLFVYGGFYISNGESWHSRAARVLLCQVM